MLPPPAASWQTCSPEFLAAVWDGRAQEDRGPRLYWREKHLVCGLEEECEYSWTEKVSCSWFLYGTLPRRSLFVPCTRWSLRIYTTFWSLKKFKRELYATYMTLTDFYSEIEHMTVMDHFESLKAKTFTWILNCNHCTSNVLLFCIIRGRSWVMSRGCLGPVAERFLNCLTVMWIFAVDAAVPDHEPAPRADEGGRSCWPPSRATSAEAEAASTTSSTLRRSLRCSPRRTYAALSTPTPGR